MHVEPGTLKVFSDIGCPWAHVAIYRLHEARRGAGLEDDLDFDMHAFPLELINRRPTPKKILDLEILVAGDIAPDAGWQLWERPDYQYPVTTLLALEAVHAAKSQSLRAGEQLDRALRMAFFGESRTISMQHEILERAADCDAVDESRLEEDLATGAARTLVVEDFRIARSDEVQGSPHVFLANGMSEHNPGTKVEWRGASGRRYPVVVDDRPERYDELVRAAVG